MTQPDGLSANIKQDMRVLVFKLLGSFSHVPNLIDELVGKTYLDSRVPVTAGFLWEKAISRIREQERPQFLQMVAWDISSDADLSCFNDVYARVKALRNEAAPEKCLSTRCGSRLES